MGRIRQRLKKYVRNPTPHPYRHRATATVLPHAWTRERGDEAQRHGEKTQAVSASTTRSTAPSGTTAAPQESS
jgi:hypothetical protein